EPLGQPDKGALAQNGGFPDEAVTARREQCEQRQQRTGHGQQPEPVHPKAQQPTAEAALLQDRQQRRRQLGGTGIARQFFAQPQPKPPQRTAGIACEEKAQQPADQSQQIQPEQAAQRPEPVDRPLAVAQRRPGQPCA